MRPHGGGHGPFLGLLALALTVAPGCMSFLHPVPPPPPPLAQPCHDLPPGCRGHVYIFMVHGLDPLDYANLEGVNRYLHDLGFSKTYLGQLYHTPYFDSEVRHIHHEDPDAHFVLIGFSFGANMVRTIAQAVKDEGIDIDLLVYLGGNTLKNVPYDRPDNCHKIVNILAQGCIWNGTAFPDAENVDLPDVYHFGSPSHPQTLEILARELVQVAAAVPVVLPTQGEVPTPDDEPLPMPRRLDPAAARSRPALPEGWELLNPRAPLRPPTRPGTGG